MIRNAKTPRLSNFMDTPQTLIMVTGLPLNEF